VLWQGSNFVVGVVLMFLAEEEAFWLLVFEKLVGGVRARDRRV
jgi:hypothetical protein